MGSALFGALAMVLLAGTASALTLDVSAYGAKPDGTTDNTAAIQKAIDSCSVQGGGSRARVRIA